MPPTFCRHNRFIQNCPICREPEPRKPARAPRSSTPRARWSGTSSRASQSALRVRRVEQAADDGYRSELAPGLKASADAARLAGELAFAAARLDELQRDPPGTYAQIGAEPDPEEAYWLAFLTAYLSPTEGDEPFAGIRAAQVPWSRGELPDLDVALGPRTSHEPANGERTVLAYRAWSQRAGGQAAAFAGEGAWTPERRFDRVFERLALPGFGRAGRYELLVTLGRLGVCDVRPSSLQLTDDATTVAAKRVFGIGDKLLLERRARELADEAELPIEALDVALFNWAAPAVARTRLGSRVEASAAPRDAIAGALGL
ncbi:MAG: hypothetical protein M3401_18305 [Actinomycetota bacterium]|nr:hypothetical protein [Actinomycetota bacterium]